MPEAAFLVQGLWGGVVVAEDTCQAPLGSHLHIGIREEGAGAQRGKVGNLRSCKQQSFIGNRNQAGCKLPTMFLDSLPLSTLLTLLRPQGPLPPNLH